MFDVDIYIEIDGSDKKTRHRTYAAKIKFVTPKKKEQIRKVSGTEKTTEGGIVLLALTSALNKLTKPCKVIIHMKECPYVTEGICRGRMYEWFANGWKTIRGEPIKNRSEWEKIIRFTEKHRISFKIVKTTHEYSNELQEDIKETKGQNWQQQKIGGEETNGH